MAQSDVLTLRMRDIDRLKIIQQVLDGRLSGRQAAAQLQLSRRQVIRLKQRIQKEGNQGIIHKLRGRRSNHRLAPALIHKAIELMKKPLYEGFGLPPLEAMSLGCPVIMSNCSSLPEVGADAACYVNPVNVDDIASALERTLVDERFRREIRERGFRRAMEFSPERMGEELADLYRKAMTTRP